jgi:lipopolysaccharide/colanic/teichoic acid biosynthesis glycosyltransferase
MVQTIDIKTNVIVTENTGVRRNKRESTALAGSGARASGSPFPYRLWKNILDRSLALAGIIVSLPLMGIIALIIKLDSPGSAIYRREQVGEKGKHFTAFKFRTMQYNNDESIYQNYIVRYIRENAPYKVTPDGQAIYKVVDDPRVTRFGALLRRTNLDELPQLINIIKGEMSFVGPRPDIPLAVSLYHPWHMKRLDARPGLTGLWQVSGRKRVKFEGMVRLDICYIKRQSLLLDAKILLLTVGTVLKGDGS